MDKEKQTQAKNGLWLVVDLVDQTVEERRLESQAEAEQLATEYALEFPRHEFYVCHIVAAARVDVSFEDITEGAPHAG